MPQAQKTRRIKLTTSIGGHQTDPQGRVRQFTYGPDREVDWPEDEAQRLVDAGHAEYVTAK